MKIATIIIMLSILICSVSIKVLCDRAIHKTIISDKENKKKFKTYDWFTVIPVLSDICLCEIIYALKLYVFTLPKVELDDSCWSVTVGVIVGILLTLYEIFVWFFDRKKLIDVKDFDFLLFRLVSAFGKGVLFIIALGVINLLQYY